MDQSSLYKYIPFQAPTVENNNELQLKRQSCFENGEIWYPKAYDLNDPYECHPEFVLPDEEVKNIVESLDEEEFILVKERSGISTKEELLKTLNKPNGFAHLSGPRTLNSQQNFFIDLIS